MNIDDLSLWKAFIAVAKQGGFNRAGAHLKTPTSQISKRVSKLEEQLGIALFKRSTRVVRLTDEGNAILPRAITLIEDAVNLENSFESESEITGTLNLTCIPFYAHHLLPPVIDQFLTMHPKCHVNVDLSFHLQDLVDSEFEIAIRVGEPQGLDLVYRKLVDNHLIFCASPEYLKKTKHRLSTPSDLSLHSTLILDIIIDSQFRAGPHKGVAVRDFKPIRRVFSDNGAFLVELARLGFGVLLRAEIDVREDLKSGKLVEVLKNHPLETFEAVYAVTHKRKYLSRRVRAFLDVLMPHAKGWRS